MGHLTELTREGRRPRGRPRKEEREEGVEPDPDQFLMFHEEKPEDESPEPDDSKGN